MTLAETQAAFHALATRTEAPPVAATDFLVGSQELAATERIALYADMYLWRLTDALREDYPKVAAVLGDERFFALAKAYATAHPSDHPDLGRFGRRLPSFLRRFPAPERADLHELAALEWARSEVFFDAPADPVGRDALAALDRAAVSEARLELIPALRILRLEHDVHTTWRRLDDGETGGPVLAVPTAVVVWRTGFDVFHTMIEPDEADALERAVVGERLAAICEAFAGRDDPPAAAFAALVSWFDEGWIASISTDPT
jgi:hypothetical protein